MTSFLDRVRSGMTGKGPMSWVKPKQPKEKSPLTVRTNRFDEEVWKTVRKVPSIDQMIYDLSLGDEHREGEVKGFDGAPELVHDLFFTFYKAAAEVKGKKEVTKESYPVRHMVEEIMNNPRLQELQPTTAGDTVLSTIAVESMLDSVKEILARIPPPPQPKNDDWCECYGDRKVDKHSLKTCVCQCHEDSQCPPPPPGGDPGPPPPKTQKRNPPPPQKGEDPGDNPQPGGKGDEDDEDEDESEPEDDDEGDEEGEGGEGDDFDPDEDDAEQDEMDWQSMFDELLDDLDIDRLTNKALQAAEDEVGELDSLRRGIGLEDGEWRAMSPEKRLSMAEKLRHPNMKALADIVGRMKRFALGLKATRINDVPHEIYDVELGSDVRRVLKSEFALLSDPEAQYEFYRRYASRELMQFKMRGTELVGKGPIVICIDKSGSMNGGPFNWAMAVAEALRRFASDEDRDYYALFFGANNDRHRFDFPKGKGEFEKVLAFLSCQANGGTQFDGVLEEALLRATQTFDAEGKAKADIVFVTDGQAALSDDWIKAFNEERERVGVRVYAVYIGGASDMRYHNGPLGLLKRISDVVIPVSELRPESAAAIFERV